MSAFLNKNVGRGTLLTINRLTRSFLEKCIYSAFNPLPYYFSLLDKKLTENE